MEHEKDLINYDYICEIGRLRREIAMLTAKRFYSRKKLVLLQNDLLRRIDQQLKELAVAANVHHAMLTR